MRYRFYLDGNLLQDEPKGWKELVTSITEYDELRAVLLTQDVTLSFIGDGYTYLKDIFESDEVCALTELVIEYECSTGLEEIFRGTIFLTSVSFLNNECKTKVEDNSFFARINNNKSIKAYLTVARSKNGQTITAATESDINFFNPCNCNYEQSRKGYTIFEAFKYIISFISDGEVGFVSDEFDAGGDWEGHRISTGWRLRDAGETDIRTIPFYSFKEIFQEVNKKYNIGMSVETIAGVPSIRIEPFTYFRTADASVTLSNPTNVKISTDISQLYAKVIIGSDKTYKTDSCSNGGYANFPENVNYVGFKEEEFPLLTECNIDTELNLVSSWIISSNVIQEIIFSGNSEYDEEIVFIEAGPGGLTIQTDVFSDGNCYFNYFYSNFKTLERWSSALPNTVQVILGSQNNTFLAYVNQQRSLTLDTTTSTYTTSTVDGFGNTLEPFQDDFFFGNDPSTSYGTTVNPIVAVPQGTPVTTPESIYLVPTNGNYVFESLLALSGIFPWFFPIPGTLLMFFTLKITLNHYDSAGLLINFYSNSGTMTLGPSSTPLSQNISVSTGVINCSAGDYLSVTYEFTANFNSVAYKIDFNIDGVLAPSASFFQCNFFQGFGGELIRAVNTDFANILFEFEYPISFTQFKTIKSDTKKPIAFDFCGKTYKAWIKDIKYNHHKNSKLVLRTSKNEFRNP